MPICFLVTMASSIASDNELDAINVLEEVLFGIPNLPRYRAYSPHFTETKIYAELHTGLGSS